jgi:hypothetical protein
VLSDHHLDLSTSTDLEAKIPVHWNSHLAVQVNFSFPFEKQCKKGIDGSLSDCDYSKSSFAVVSLCQVPTIGIIRNRPKSPVSWGGSGCTLRIRREIVTHDAIDGAWHGLLRIGIFAKQQKLPRLVPTAR